MSKVEAIKEIIDIIESKGNAYKHENRCQKKCGLTFLYIPCIFYSTTVRILICPFNCVFNKNTQCNPISSILIGTSVTLNSDKCIMNGCEKINEKYKITNLHLNKMEVREIVIYAANKIKTNTNMKTKYEIADYIGSLTFKINYKLYPTPYDIIQLADAPLDKYKSLDF
jgi:hypothetical protein